MPRGGTDIAYHESLEDYLSVCFHRRRVREGDPLNATYNKYLSGSEDQGHSMMQPDTLCGSLESHPHYRRSRCQGQPPRHTSPTPPLRISPSPDRNTTRSGSATRRAGGGRDTSHLTATTPRVLPAAEPPRRQHTANTTTTTTTTHRTAAHAAPYRAEPHRTPPKGGAWWESDAHPYYIDPTQEAREASRQAATSRAVQRGRQAPTLLGPSSSRSPPKGRVRSGSGGGGSGSRPAAAQRQRDAVVVRRTPSSGRAVQQQQQQQQQQAPRRRYGGVVAAAAPPPQALQRRISPNRARLLPEATGAAFYPTPSDMSLPSDMAPPAPPSRGGSAASASLEEANANLSAAISMMEAAPRRGASAERQHVSFAEEATVVAGVGEARRGSGGDLDPVEHIGGLGILDALRGRGGGGEYSHFVEDWEGGNWDASEVGDVARRMTFGDGVRWKRVAGGGGYAGGRGSVAEAVPHADGLGYRSLNGSYAARAEARSQQGLFNMSDSWASAGTAPAPLRRSSSNPSRREGPVSLCAATYNPLRLNDLSQPKRRDTPVHQAKQKRIPGPWRGRPPQPWDGA